MVKWMTWFMFDKSARAIPATPLDRHCETIVLYVNGCYLRS